MFFKPTVLVISLILIYLDASACQNVRVAPGVPPHHYNSQNQQYYQPAAQYNVQPVIQQQQQQYYSAPQYQPAAPAPPSYIPPQGFAPAAAHPGQHGQQFLLDTSNIAQERQHIQEHMDVPIDTSKMSEDELLFHYFKMHDADGDNKLDGCELVNSIIHWHDDSNHHEGHGTAAGGHTPPNPRVFSDAELADIVDPMLEHADKNRDGFIDYAEFIRARQ